MNSEDGKLSDRTSWKTSDSDDGKEKTKINLRQKRIGKDIPYSLKIWLLPIYTIKPCDYGEVMQNWLRERERERERETMQRATATNHQIVP